MPASRRALAVTDDYRAKTRRLRARAAQVAEQHWTLLDPADLDSSHARWRAAVAPSITQLQRVNARLSSAYLASFVTVEVGKRTAILPPSVAAVGINQAGRPIPDALTASLFVVKAAISDGHSVTAALGTGLAAGARVAGEDVMYAGRAALTDAMTSSDQVEGWTRVTGGGCGACLAAADGSVHTDDEDLEVHPFCECSAEPRVAGVPNTVERPTGEAMFHSMATEAQDKLLGPDKAALVRDGAVPFHALIGRSSMDAIPDQITEAPLEALHHH